MDGGGEKNGQAEILTRPSQMAAAVAGRELERAGDELRSEARATLRMSTAAGAALIAGLLGLHLVTLALVETASRRMPRWAAYAVVGGGFLGAGAAAGGYAWTRRPERPLGRTRANMRRILQFMLDRLG